MAQFDRHMTNEQLSAFLDGQLASEEQAQWDSHLKTCEQCQQELANLRQVVALLHALPQPQLPRSFVLPADSSVSIATEHQVKEKVPSQPARRQGWPTSVRYTIRTLSTLAAVIGIFFLLSSMITFPLPQTAGTVASSVPTNSGGSADSHVATSGTVEASATYAASAANTMSANDHPERTQATPEASPAAQAKKEPASPPHAFGPQLTGLPVHPVFDLSTQAGRIRLGLLLLAVGILGFVLLTLHARGLLHFKRRN
ncbi:hypothetical protein EPA93_38330 [Ktedonosporobacter rubrisoli]|uniref:Putative zinc-finger domain-containing protein n=1 Tax=Ktedonosporobacter rubrisoli TaxID=2509675 RepID=A0A4P6K073_KTERU|nr:zf-HC2 domain-containing protein [Ktedonosporobacter rubrisoli]QBD81517.1 hypothetical protein EPA93_38330 [Ktedonosporobacter rubrisoli]